MIPGSMFVEWVTGFIVERGAVPRKGVLSSMDAMPPNSPLLDLNRLEAAFPVPTKSIDICLVCASIDGMAGG